VSEKLDEHPTVAIEDVEPVFVRAMMIGAMATRYATAANLSLEDAFPFACATWNTDWPDDPEPRTFEAARQAVNDDLEYWDE
jgi:hypothetical protein